MKYIFRSIILMVCPVLWVTTLSAQPDDFKPFVFPDKLSDKYQIDPKKDYERVLTEDFPTDDQREIELYGEMVSFSKYDMFSSGEIYLGWEEMETYLNKIINHFLPDSVDKSTINAYVSYRTEMNAFAIHDGSLFCNVGLIANSSTEAGLAMVLAHELSHYLNKDSKDGYFKNIELEDNKPGNDTIYVERAKFSRQQEHEADVSAMKLLKNTDYDLRHGKSTFQSLMLEEELRKKSKYRKRSIVNIKKDGSVLNPLEKLLATHPEKMDRIREIEEYSNSLKDNSKRKAYVIDEALFNRLRTLARLETLQILFDNNSFNDCIGNAFLYHLYEPENKAYVYYMLESMRRLRLVVPDIDDAGFLTEAYDDNFDEGKGILNDLKFFIPDSIDYSMIKANVLKDKSTIEFNNYREAFDYFEKIALEMNIRESYLTLGLQYYDDKEKSKSFIDKYLSFENIAHRKYAEHLRDGKLVKSLWENETKLVLLNELIFLEKRSYGFHYRRLKAYEESKSYYDQLAESFKDYGKNTQFVSVFDFRNESFNRYKDLQKVILTSAYFSSHKQVEELVVARSEIKEGKSIDGSVTFVFDDEDDEPANEPVKPKKKKNAEKDDGINPDILETSGRLNLFVFSPFTWEYFHENNLHGITYFNAKSYQNKKAGAHIANVASALTLMPVKSLSTYIVYQHIMTIEKTKMKGYYAYVEKKMTQQELAEKIIEMMK